MNLLYSLCRLRKNEKRPREEILSLQKKRLSALLHHAWEHSAYYRETFEKAGLTEEKLDDCALSDLPVMNKKALMDHFDEVITTNAVTQTMLREFDTQHSKEEKKLPGGFHIVHSSGSTGEPQFFLYDQTAWNEMLSGIVRGALWGMSIQQIAKLLAGGIRILYIAAVDGRYGGVMAIDDGVLGLGGRFWTLDINRPLQEWEKVVREYDPNVVIAYPSAMKIFAGLMEKGKVCCRLKRVITCGEPLSGSMRTYLEKVLGQRIINFYGASESLALGVEADPSGGMILFDDMNILENVDGELFLTCLYNYVQPIIRYKLNDQMDFYESKGFPAFTRAKGQIFRDEDVLWFENEEGKEEFLHPLAIEGFCVDGLLDFQFIQVGGSALKMLAQISQEDKKETIRESMKHLMGKILKEKRLTNVKFEICFADDIMPDEKTGKKRLVMVQNPGRW